MLKLHQALLFTQNSEDDPQDSLSIQHQEPAFHSKELPFFSPQPSTTYLVRRQNDFDWSLTMEQVREMWANGLAHQDITALKDLWIQEEEGGGKKRIVYEGGFFYVGEAEDCLPHGRGYLSLKDHLVVLKGVWERGRLVTSC